MARHAHIRLGIARRSLVCMETQLAERGIQRLHPAIRVVWWVQGAITALPLAAGALAVDILVDLPGPRGLLTLAVLIVFGVPAALIPLLSYRRWGFELRSDDLWIRSGIFWRKVSVIPYIRLQFVDTKQGPIERQLGLTRLVVYTAAVGTTGELPGLATDVADQLRERLAQLEGDTGGL